MAGGGAASPAEMVRREAIDVLPHWIRTGKREKRSCEKDLALAHLRSALLLSTFAHEGGLGRPKVFAV